MKRKGHIRLTPDVRREQVVMAALELAHSKPYWAVTRNELADAVGIAGSVVQYHFGTVKQMRRAIMRAAVHREDLLVIAQGIAAQDPHALRAPADLRARAVKTLHGYGG